MTTFLEAGDVERFRGIVAARLGLQFEDSKLGFLAEVLRKRLDVGNQESTVYLSRLESDAFGSLETGELARDLTVGETYFFRNRDQFRAFAEMVLPDRMRARRADRTIRVLSAGCASGEEAYTLAIILREVIADPSWNISIRAVDINPAALERAAAARFSPWALRETPPDVQERWFRQSGRDLVLADEIRTAVTFEPKNLTRDDADLWRPGFYDAIFCRNVIMYFSPETMRAVVSRIYGALAPGGYFFLGHAETLRGLSQDFHLLHTHEAFYYQSRNGREHPPEPLPPVTSLPRYEVPPSIPSESTAWVDVIAQAAERIRALDTSSNGAAPPRRAPPSTDAPPKWNLAEVQDLLRRDRFEEALALVRSMPPAASRDPDVLLLTAVLLAHSGQLAAAAEVAARLLAIDELNAGAHYVLALSHEGSGERAAAISHDHFAIYLDGEFAMPRLHLGLMAKRAGDRASARRELSQALLLLQREDLSRLMLFGGGFTREGLIGLCRAELASAEGRS